MHHPAPAPAGLSQAACQARRTCPMSASIRVGVAMASTSGSCLHSEIGKAVQAKVAQSAHEAWPGLDTPAIPAGRSRPHAPQTSQLGVIGKIGWPVLRLLQLVAGVHSKQPVEQADEQADAADCTKGGSQIVGRRCVTPRPAKGCCWMAHQTSTAS